MPRAEVTRHEEELEARTEAIEVGSVRLRKTTDSEEQSEDVTREREEADCERTEPFEHDSGEIETLPDGSVSVPVFEEELVVTKRLVVRERVLIRKRTITESERVQATLKKERVEVDIDEPPPD